MGGEHRWGGGGEDIGMLGGGGGDIGGEGWGAHLSFHNSNKYSISSGRETYQVILCVVHSLILHLYIWPNIFKYFFSSPFQDQ